MADTAKRAAARRSRFLLFAPFMLLMLVAAGWSIAWLLLRQRTADGLDAWLASEADAGRQWTCADRSVGGYPFRLEISCRGLTLRRGAATVSLGRLVTVALAYQPGHIIAEVGGPLRADDGEGVALEADWRLLQTSLQSTPKGFQRASLVIDAPKVRIGGLGPAELDGSAAHVELHVRPDPARYGTDGAYDLEFDARTVAFPALDALVGGEEPADVSLEATVMQGRALTGRPPPEDAERWREAGGAIEIARWALAKGARRLEVKGTLRLDDLHRPAGELHLAAAGIEDLVGLILGRRAADLGAAAGALFGPPPWATPPFGRPAFGHPRLGRRPRAGRAPGRSSRPSCRCASRTGACRSARSSSRASGSHRSTERRARGE